MIKFIGLYLVGCALCVTPVAADEDAIHRPRRKGHAPATHGQVSLR